MLNVHDLVGVILGQERQECISGGAVLGDIRGVQALVDELHQEIYGKDGLARARAALDHNGALLSVFLTLKHCPLHMSKQTACSSRRSKTGVPLTIVLNAS